VNVEHLFLGTPRENLLDAIKKGRHKGDVYSRYNVSGEKNSAAKLKDSEVLEMRHKYIPGIYSAARLAKEFGIKSSQAYRIIKGVSRQRAI
jgi:DNA invertase Pin-like site-specific DNA recombinase